MNSAATKSETPSATVIEPTNLAGEPALTAADLRPLIESRDSKPALNALAAAPLTEIRARPLVEIIEAEATDERQ